MIRSVFLIYVLLMVLVAGFVQELGPVWIEEIAGPHSNRPTTLLTLHFICEIPFFLFLSRLETTLGFLKTLFLSFLLMGSGLWLLSHPTLGALSCGLDYKRRDVCSSFYSRH